MGIGIKEVYCFIERRYFKLRMFLKLMAEEGNAGYGGDRFFSDVNTRIRDIEEKQRLLKDRLALVSDSFVKERDQTFNDLQEMKKTVETLKLENERMKELIVRIGQSVDRSARREDFMILQRQFNMFRGDR